MKGVIKNKAKFQDWWKNKVGEEIEIIGEQGKDYVTNVENPFTNSKLLIPKECVDITDSHPDLSHLSDEVLLREVKERKLKLK